MLKYTFISLLFTLSVLASVVKEHRFRIPNQTSTHFIGRAPINRSVKVCDVGSENITECKTLENTLEIAKFITGTRIKVQVRDEPLAEVHKYFFTGLLHVEDLIMCDCGVIYIEAGTFFPLISLKKLDLRRNYIEHIKPGVFNYLLLAELDLSHNKIKIVEADALNHMKNLRQIDLSNNLISTYDPKWFLDAPNLSQLHLENNFVRALPESAFRNLIDLESEINIFFSFNRINFVHPLAFNDMGKTTIEKLYMDHNLLDSWHANWSMNINDLKIAFNNVTCIHGDIAAVIKNNTLQNFAYNPYNCTCLKEIKIIGDGYGLSSQWFMDKYLRCRHDFKPRNAPHRAALRNMQIFSSP
ncbi:leucine-rich repeat-containing protein 15-like [Sitophilus oryzae]|uniref:Leucine-rich repeat-containing protein 15-like n=1 Tax=Sitophilus oryzae TaxID=7048 RepID=A0A6J2YA81_SITOR|nr:leucine-rich repeat-containing protein 15-like [Sitophilus oryzae]